MPEQGPIPARPPIPRDLGRQAYFASQLLERHGLPTDPEYAGQMENMLAIMHNYSDLRQEGSPFLTAVQGYFRRSTEASQFEVQNTTTELTDLLFTGTTQPNMFDYMQVVRAGSLLIGQGAEGAPELEARKLTLLLNDTYSEMLTRVPLTQVKGEGDLDLTALYRRAFGRADTPKTQAFLADVIFEGARRIVRDHIILDEVISDARLMSPWYGRAPNFYNAPLSREGAVALNEATAAIIERLHLLKAYEVAPIIVPAATVDFQVSSRSSRRFCPYAAQHRARRRPPSPACRRKQSESNAHRYRGGKRWGNAAFPFV
jgi:hypothetical protein